MSRTCPKLGLKSWRKGQYSWISFISPWSLNSQSYLILQTFSAPLHQLSGTHGPASTKSLTSTVLSVNIPLGVSALAEAGLTPEGRSPLLIFTFSHPSILSQEVISILCASHCHFQLILKWQIQKVCLGYFSVIGETKYPHPKLSSQFVEVSLHNQLAPRKSVSEQRATADGSGKYQKQQE